MNPTPDSRRAIAAWLLICAALVLAMVVVGGVTRLTHSGLSIVEWQPLVGTIPPLNDAEWDAAFDKYKVTPEYQQVNFGMSVAEFKNIFYVEWAHRLLGRGIGLVFLIPFLYFLIRRRLDRALLIKLATLFVLGGLQGALGWYMVASGLVDVPRVSPYRLTAHLGLAVVIYGYMLWLAFDLLYGKTPVGNGTAPLRTAAMGLTALIFVMILSGGFVAGTRAGFSYNSFPLMGESFVPPGLYVLEPWWLNGFENVATVQFNHRLLAYVIALLGFAFWWRARRLALTPRARLGSHLLLVALILQMTLGITTLLTVVSIPFAAAHQGGALLLLSAALYVTHALPRLRAAG